MRIEPEAIVVKWYYFPIATSKRIPFSTIRRIEAGAMADLDLTETKSWGMGLPRGDDPPLTPGGPTRQDWPWWPCDMKRTFRDYYVVLHLTTWPNCGLTFPAEVHERVLRVLEKAYDAYRQGAAANAAASGSAALSTTGGSSASVATSQQGQ